VSHRSEPGTSLHGFRVECTLKAPIKNFLTLINEVDLFSEWLPFVAYTKQHARYHRASRVVVVELSVPWPFANRDICLHAVSADGLDTSPGCVFLTVQSFEKDDGDGDDATLLSPRPGATRVDVKYGACFMRPISRNLCRVMGIVHVDPKLAIVPPKIINFIAVQVMYWGCIYFERKARALAKADPTKDAHHLRVQQDPEVYEKLLPRLEKFFVDSGMPEEEFDDQD